MTQKLGPIQEQFVKNLESENFLQGDGVLAFRTEEGDIRYCCLGVFCVTINLETKQKENNNEILFGDEDATAYLPVGISETYGFISTSGNFKNAITIEEGTFSSLISMNDNKKTFSEIAKVIRANPSNVFSKEA